MMQFRECMTDAMLEVCDGFQEEMEQECLYCVENLKKANQAENISLPHTNERGVPVVHGARVVMHNISDYWYNRLSYARRFVSSEFEEKHGLWNRKAGL